MQDIFVCMKTRRSVRRYKPDAVPQELLAPIVEAGLYAASGLGRQSPIILQVTDRACPTYVYDGSLALGNMMLAAHAEGLGGCWIHRAKEVFSTEAGKEILHELGVEGDYEGIGHLAVGYPDGEYPAPPARRDGRVFYAD